jgi:hypothetical protein
VMDLGGLLSRAYLRSVLAGQPRSTGRPFMNG